MLYQQDIKLPPKEKNEAKQVVLDQCCRGSAASMKKMVAESRIE